MISKGTKKIEIRMQPDETFRVVPRTIRVNAEEAVEFRVVSDSSEAVAQVLFPEGSPFVDTVTEQTTVTPGNPVTATVKSASQLEYMDYEYAVYCILGDRREFALASMPIIIIYPI
jgi:hypothetical protein